MSNFISKTMLAALVAFGAIGASAPAHAGGVDVDIRINGPRVVHRPIVVRPPVVVVRPPVVVRNPVVVLQPAHRGACNPVLALEKARNNGMNRVHVSHVGPNRVAVEGRFRGTWAKMMFANVRGCPRL
ncbi:hypothetical protein [Rhizobium alvei]|uniref:SH3 domain-containing protein n=1 Tax=Rhizobium alvei TaxID=1132659 RepID=A0ABT8YV82_9HYPH|nr:hypothetical protein [Rhizobium alvei]MDO6967089.1 hypothetical protein [Rhizobium alvei]